MEFAYVLEIAVDGGKADARDFVDLLQSLHDHLSDLGSRSLAVRRIDHVLLNVVHDLLHGAHGNRTLLAGAQKPGEDLLTLKLFPTPVFLDHHVGNLVDALVGGEALFALQALAPAADGSAFPVLARVHDFVIFEAAKRAFHSFNVWIGASLIVTE